MRTNVAVRMDLDVEFSHWPFTMNFPTNDKVSQSIPTPRQSSQTTTTSPQVFYGDQNVEKSMCGLAGEPLRTHSTHCTVTSVARRTLGGGNLGHRRCPEEFVDIDPPPSRCRK